MAPVAIIILNYRTAEMTMACAETALAQLPEGGVIVIVDNQSGDGSVEKLAAWHQNLAGREKVQIVASPVNDGFSGGNNRGMRTVEAEFYLLLNSDAFLKDGALGAMLTTARAHPEAGLVNPVLVGTEDEVQISRFRKFTPVGEFLRASGLGVFARLFPRDVVAIDLADATSQPDWVSFACVLLNGRMVREIGFMDDGYFLYFEDAEYAERAKAAGWQIVQATDARVEHRRGGSSPVKSLAQAKKRLPRYYYESRARYFISRYGSAGFTAANLAWYLGRLAGYGRLLGAKLPDQPCANEWRDIWIRQDKA